jgi:hypothetical protein
MLSFLLHYYKPSIFVDIEWLLSTLFDASLLSLRAAGNGGSFFCSVSGQTFPNGYHFVNIAPWALDRPVPTRSYLRPSG